MSSAEPFISRLVAPGGAGLCVIDLDGAFERRLDDRPGQIRLGVSCENVLPRIDPEAFDILLCGHSTAPRPWVGVDPERLRSAVEALQAQVERAPAAATVAAQVLRTTSTLRLDEALLIESFAYSMLLASGEFRAWRASTPVRSRPERDVSRVHVEVRGKSLSIELNRPSARNAFDARMRDELVEALDFAADHPDAPHVVLSGRGPAFSAGGDLDEFGLAADAAQAHLIRTLQSPVRLLDRIRNRITACLHGACIGAGIETPAAAGRVTARAGASFRLPEVSMGLIPGAGGTASIARRIGRHRTCYMAVSGTAIDHRRALAWGLIDAIAPEVELDA